MLLLISAYIADLIFGDPEWFPHPVKGMGKLISFLDGRLRGNYGKRRERRKGVILAVVVVGVSSLLAYFFVEVSGKVNFYLGKLAWVYLGYTTLSVKDLRVKAKKILKEVRKGSLIEARKRLSEIVGRDTRSLNEDKITAATIESIAENTNDGIIAPLFYLILGGPVFAVAYKSINTLDSMLGYKNEKYLYFGWFSARLDDAANFIPARITGLLIACASFITGKGFKSSFKTMLKDGQKHSSPNSGISEAAMAGALGIKLGGVYTYRGKAITAPYIGGERRDLQPFFINEALNISLITSILMVSMGVILKWLI